MMATVELGVQDTPATTPRLGISDSKHAADNRFCRVFLATTLSLFVAIATVNFVVNPYAQYPTTWFEPMVLPSRAEKVSLLGQYDPAPKGLILGSSRVLKMEPNYLQERTGLEFFNAGVNYGKTEDFLALVRYYQDTFQHPPTMIVLGLDVNAFTDGSPPDPRLLSNPDLARRVPEAIEFSQRMHRWCELLSWNQTKLAVQSLHIQLTAAERPEPIESFRKDGLIVYHQRERELAEGTYDFASALDYSQHEYASLFRAFHAMSPMRCQVFEHFVSLCETNGTRLVVYLTPLHPELTSYLSAHGDYELRREQVTEFVRGQAAGHRFQFLDLSTVDKFGGDPTLFVDGVHPLEPNTRRIIDHLVGPRAGTVANAVQ